MDNFVHSDAGHVTSRPSSLHTSSSELATPFEGDINSQNNQIEQFFKIKGVRWTPQRQMVIDSFRDNSGHISAEEIHAQIKQIFPKVNLSTVYRTLELLCELGVAVEVATQGDDRRRYELVGADRRHHHLVCQHCQADIELDNAVVEEIINAVQLRYGFSLKLPHFVGYGLCEICARSTQLN